MTHLNHTPGPWIIDTYGQIIDCADRVIVHVVRGHRISIRGKVTQQDDGGVANAKLIRGAPEMYAALKGLLEFMGNSWPENKHYKKAKLTIERIEGEK